MCPALDDELIGAFGEICEAQLIKARWLGVSYVANDRWSASGAVTHSSETKRKGGLLNTIILVIGGGRCSLCSAALQSPSFVLGKPHSVSSAPCH